LFQGLRVLGSGLPTSRVSVLLVVCRPLLLLGCARACAASGLQAPQPARAFSLSTACSRQCCQLTHPCAFAHTHMHAHTCIYTRTHARVHTHTHTRSHTRTCTCVHTHAHTHAHAHMYPHTLTHTHMHICLHTHAHMHTHAHIRAG